MYFPILQSPLLDSELWSVLGSMATVIALGASAYSFWQGRQDERKRATLADFPQLRERTQALLEEVEKLEEGEEKDARMKSYMQLLERFAVGVNTGAYDIRIINRMSGGMLINQFEKVIRPFVERRRREIELRNPEIKKSALYCEYETMIQKLYRIRHKKWPH